MLFARCQQMTSSCLTPSKTNSFDFISHQRAFVSTNDIDKNRTILYYPYDIYPASTNLQLSRFIQSLRQVFDREYTNDISSKLHISFTESHTLSSEHKNKKVVTITVTRLDNMIENKETYPDFVYKPIDMLWRQYTGWPDALTLELKLSQVICIHIPSNPNHDMLSFTISLPTLTTTVPEMIGFPKDVYQISSFIPTPISVQKSIYSFEYLNPSWSIHLYTYTLARQMIQELESDKVLNAYDTLTPNAFKADLWRYVVLYHRGGVYADCKATLLTPLDHFLNKLIQGKKGVIVNDIRGAGLVNGFIAVYPKTSLLRLAIDGIVTNVQNKDYSKGILGVSGPKHLYNSFLELSDEEQKEYKRIQFKLTGIAVTDGMNKQPLFLFHNAEYRRVWSRPGMQGHYEEMFLNRTVYGEIATKVLTEKSTKQNRLFLWSIAVIVLFVLLALLKVVKSKNRDKRAKKQ